MSGRVEYAQMEEVGTIQLRPAVAGKPPTLDLDVLAELDSALAEAERAGPRVVFVRSTESKYFCVGADVGSLTHLDLRTIDRWIARGHEVFARLEDLSCPVVACVSGYALGGGFELAMACDLIFAAEPAHFGQTEAKLGFVAGWGGTYRLPRRVGFARAKELFFSARIVPAAEAFSLGMIDFCGDGSALEEHGKAFTAAVRSGSAVSAREYKRMLGSRAETTRAGACTAEISSSQRCVGDPETRARVDAFLSRRR